VAAKDDEGKTPLDGAMEKGHPEIAGLLRERGSQG